MLLCSAVQAQTTGVFPYRWNDGPPADAITPADIREALVWTGHLDFFFKGELSGAVRKGTQAWQKAKGHQPTDKLSDEQTGSTHQGCPQGTRLRRLVHPARPCGGIRDRRSRPSSRASARRTSTAAHSTITPRHDHPVDRLPSTATRPAAPWVRYYPSVTAGAALRTRADNWFAAVFNRGDGKSYLKVKCHQTGSIVMEMTVTDATLEKHPGLFFAMASSLMLMPRARSHRAAAAARRRSAIRSIRLLRRASGSSPTESQSGQALAHRRLRQDRRAQARNPRRRRPARRRGVRQGVRRRLRRQGRPASRFGGGDQRQRTPDQLSRHGRSRRGQDRPRQGRDARQGRLAQCRRRSLRAAHGNQARQMGHGPSLRRHQGRRARHHHRHAAGP